MKITTAIIYMEAHYIVMMVRLPMTVEMVKNLLMERPIVQNNKYISNLKIYLIAKSKLLNLIAINLLLNFYLMV